MRGLDLEKFVGELGGTLSTQRLLKFKKKTTNAAQGPTEYTYEIKIVGMSAYGLGTSSSYKIQHVYLM